ncbi:hypothetical protein [Rheinheimera sp. NSM]|uniref:hypothetical protein n=1 Tax=Rheinheimera sp. NSM TaxID=3457884 RepID=UPI0040363FB1
MPVNNINNSAAQLQLYANEKATAQKPAGTVPAQNQNTVTPAAQTDSVRISEQARALQSKDSSAINDNVSPLTNGMGIEPPKSN